MHVAYDFNKSNKTLNFKMKANTRNVGNINAIIDISNISSMSPDGMMQGGFPKLENVEVVYKNETYTDRLLKYCHTRSNMTKEAYIDAEVAQSDKYFDMLWGFSPGPGLREAYKDFLIKPDEITISMHPKPELNPMLMQNMSAEEIMENLNLHLKINGLLVNDLSFKIPDKEFMLQHQKRLANSINFDSLLRGGPIEPEKPVVIEKAPEKKRVTGYHQIDLSEAPQHISDFVIVTLEKGSIRKGQLIRLDKTNLYVQQKVSGGKFTMTVPRSKITKIEAYFNK
jgi:hypothetical protein